MKQNPDKQAQEARARLDRQDAHRKITAMVRRIGDRGPTAAQLEELSRLRDVANGRRR